MIKALLLDFDGLMFNTERITFTIFNEISDKTGKSFTEEEFGMFIGTGSKDPIFDLVVANGYNAKNVHEHFDKMYPNPGDGNMPGLKAFYDYAKENGFLLAVGSNSGEEHLNFVMDRAGFKIELDCMVCGQGKIAQKPAPDIYLMCAERLGVKPEECMVIEDSINGIKAGIAAGMRTLFVEDMQRMDAEVEKQLDYHVHSLFEAIDILKGLK